MDPWRVTYLGVGVVISIVAAVVFMVVEEQARRRGEEETSHAALTFGAFVLGAMWPVALGVAGAVGVHFGLKYVAQRIDQRVNAGEVNDRRVEEEIERSLLATYDAEVMAGIEPSDEMKRQVCDYRGHVFHHGSRQFCDRCGAFVP